MTQWFAVRCATRQERKARNSLHEMGFPAYLPCESRWRHTKTDKEKVDSPLFVGYLFVECDPTEWAVITDNAEGVHQFVRYIGSDGIPVPYPIPLVAIDAISAAQAKGDFDKTRPSKPSYRPCSGDKVRITASMWVGYLATVLSVSTDNRKAILELPKLGNVPLDVGQFEAA